jgi:hypothetical protein
MDIVSVIILVVLICVGVILGFVSVCLEAEYSRTVREKRDALRRKGRVAKVFPIEHEDGRRAA